MAFRSIIDDRTSFENCIGCNARVEKEIGTPHDYIGASKGCWSLYEKVLVKEYGEYGYPSETHRLTVDTYAIQHPGNPSRKSIQSVNIHLISLYYVLKKNLSGKYATQKIGKILSLKPDFKWLEPPQPNGHMTVIDVLKATNKDEHMILVKEWAESVWNCWFSIHSERIELLIKSLT